MKHSQHQLIRLYLDNLQVNVTAMGYNQVWTDWRDLDYTPDYNRGTVRKMRIYNAKPIFKTITPVLTTLRKF